MRIRIVKNHRIDKYCVETMNACVSYNKDTLSVQDIKYFNTPVEKWYAVADDGKVMLFGSYMSAEYLVEKIGNYHKGTEVIVEYEV